MGNGDGGGMDVMPTGYSVGTRYRKQEVVVVGTGVGYRMETGTPGRCLPKVDGNRHAHCRVRMEDQLRRQVYVEDQLRRQR